jgi:ribulose-phosphate 3-epimerase
MVDVVLIMTVEPGFGGQSFMQDCAQKIPIIRQNAPENMIIQVDGGINADTAKICRNLGANSFVAGSYIFNSPNMENAIKSLKGG